MLHGGLGLGLGVVDFEVDGGGLVVGLAVDLVLASVDLEDWANARVWPMPIRC